MAKWARDAIFGALIGLMLGALPGVLAAGAYVTWRMGGDLGQIDLWTYFRLLPGIGALFVGEFGRGATIGLGVMAASMIAGIALSLRSDRTSHGSAKWAEPDELRLKGLLARRIKEAKGPIWAKFGGPRSRRPYLSSEKIVHSLVAAPTGAGKGVGIVIPTLLTYRGSTVVLDVKGENYEMTARRRHQMGDRVYKFAPNAPDGGSHRYNPIDVVAAAPERKQYGEAVSLATALLMAQPATQTWIGGSREILAATVITALEHGRGTMAAVYDLLSMPAAKSNELFAMLSAMTKSGEARSVFDRYAGMEPKIVGIYLSILQDSGLRLWADADVRDVTAVSDFDISTFRSDPASLYLRVTQRDIDRLGPLLRLLLQQMFTVLQETPKGAKDHFDVLFVLDEFASLGKMEELSRAITTLRSSGAHLMIVVQSLANLTGPYGREGAGNFMTNCQLQLFMAPADIETPKYISESIGDKTRVARTKTWRQKGFEPATIQEREEGDRLIRPEEIRLMGEETVIALIQNQRPVKAHRVTWYKDPGLKQLHEGQKKVNFDKFEPGAVPETPRSGALWSDLVTPKQGKDSKGKGGAAPDLKIVASSPKPKAIETPKKRSEDRPETGAREASDEKAQEAGESPIAETGTEASEPKAEAIESTGEKPTKNRPARKPRVFRTDLPVDDHEHGQRLDDVAEAQKIILEAAEKEISEELESYAALRKGLFKDKP